MVLKAKEENKNSIYVPDIARISRIEKVSPTEKLFNISFEDEGKQNNFKFLPGQFIELTIFGLGEAPFCLASNPNNKEFFELCVRNAGSISGALHRMEEGSRIGIRGPFGRGYFPFEKMRNHNVLLIAGGLGMVPLMSLIKYIMQYREDYKELMIIYGAVNPDSILFKNDIGYWSNREDISTCVSVDNPDDKWTGEIGVGKCNHCHIGNKLVCVDGPVFSLWEIMNLKEAI